MARRRDNPYRGGDARTKAAKSAGFPARSVFKLEEIDGRVRLLRPGQRVLDLGAAPGSWSRYAVKHIEPGGRLVAVDLKPLEVALGPRSEAIVASVFDTDLPQRLGAHGPFDVVLSDMAPNTTGDRFSDQTHSYDLFARALELACALLRPGGAFVGKIFMGGDFEAARDAVRDAFETTRILRPEATRQRSFEVFLVGLGRRAPPPEEAPAG